MILDRWVNTLPHNPLFLGSSPGCPISFKNKAQTTDFKKFNLFHIFAIFKLGYYQNINNAISEILEYFDLDAKIIILSN